MAILDADTDLAVYDPAVTRLRDSDYSQTGFASQRAQAVAWLYRCIDIHNPYGIDQSEEDRGDDYLIEKEELERAAAYYCLYLIYEACVKEPNDERDVKAAHWKARAFETLSNAVIEFDTDGDDETNYQFAMGSPRIGRG